MSELHTELGYVVEELKPKEGEAAVLGSSIPLILPNDYEYNASNGKAEKVKGVQRGSMKIVPEALALLEGIQEPVSVLAICGPCRSGKSYILSRLLGTADAFELGHLMDPQTFGIWMGTKVLRGKDFTIVLLDTEGIDAVGASASQDAGILVLTILLSSQLIYNSLNVPHKGDLEKMQCFIKLAKGITVKQGERSSQSALRQFFPDFLWLLRDVSLKMQTEDGKDVDPTEYLKTKVLSRDPDEFEESDTDKVGRAILTFFSSVECATLERPSADSEIMGDIAQHTDNLNPKFNQGVNALIERLLRIARAKRGYDEASTITGVMLSIMVKQYVEAINDPNSIPALDNTWKMAVELLRKNVIDEVVMEYNKKMQTKVTEATEKGNVPMEEMAEDEKSKPTKPTLMDLHNELLDEAKDKLLKKVSHFGTSSENQGTDESESFLKQMEDRLVQREERTVDDVTKDGEPHQQKGFIVTGGELFLYIQQNRELSKTFCQKLYGDLFDPIRERVEKPPSGYEFERLLDELADARQKYNEQARGPMKWSVLQEMSKNQNLEASFKKIKGYKDKIMKEKQKAQEAELAAMEKAREMQEVYKQAQDMKKAQEETMKKMDQQHKEHMEKMQQQEKERREREEQKFKDLQMAHMKEMAEATRERNDRESAKMAEMMLTLQKQAADSNKQMVDVLARLVEKTTDKPPPPPPPPADGSFWRSLKFW